MLTPEPLIAELMDQYGLEMLPVRGSTETGGIAVACRPGAERPEYSIGRPCPGYEIRVVWIFSFYPGFCTVKCTIRSGFMQLEGIPKENGGEGPLGIRPRLGR